jgi:hypothetical protein
MDCTVYKNGATEIAGSQKVRRIADKYQKAKKPGSKAGLF